MIYKYLYHISDLHIRSITNNKFNDLSNNNFDELTNAINQFITYITNPEESLIIITGDIFHYINKINSDILIFFENLIQKLTKICKVIMIFGNHDVSPHNEENDIKILFTKIIKKTNNRLFILSEEKEYEFDNIIFIPTLFYSDTIKQINNKQKDKIYVSLYHNEIYGCLMKSINTIKKELNDNELSVIPDVFLSKYKIKKSDFKEYDLILLGHIHNNQFLQSNMAYAGSLIQNNFGEEINNQGFIKWNLLTKTGEFIKLNQDTSYISITDINYKSINYPKNSYIRLILTTEKTPQEIQNYVKTKTNILMFTQTYQYKTIKSKLDNIQHKMILSSDEDLIKIVSNKLKEMKDIKNINNIIELFTDLLKKINFSYNISPKSFKLNSLRFNNLMTYGKNNEINFNNLNGIVGLVAPNHSGKSSIIDILLFSIFKKIIRGRDNDIINARHLNDSFNSIVNFNVNNDNYEITRYGQKIKTSYPKKIQVLINDKLQKISSIEKDELNYINNKICSFEDFITSSIILQQDEGFLDLSPKDKRDNIFSIFNLDIFDDIMRKLSNSKKDYSKLIKNKHNEINVFIKEHDLTNKNIEELENINQDNIKIIHNILDKINEKKTLLVNFDEDIELSDELITTEEYNKSLIIIKNAKHNIKSCKNKKEEQQQLINNYLKIHKITNDKFNYNITEKEYNDLINLLPTYEKEKQNNIDKLNNLLIDINLLKNKLNDKLENDFNENKIISDDEYNNIDKLLNEHLQTKETIINQINELKAYLDINKHNDINYNIKISEEEHNNNIIHLKELNIKLKDLNTKLVNYKTYFNNQLKEFNDIKNYLLMHKFKINDDYIFNYNNVNYTYSNLPVINNKTMIFNKNINDFYTKYKNILKDYDSYILISSLNNIDIKCKYCRMNNQDKLKQINPKLLDLPNNELINNMKICLEYSKLISDTSIKEELNNSFISNDIYYFDKNINKQIDNYIIKINELIELLYKNNKEFILNEQIHNTQLEINKLNELIEYYNNSLYYIKLENYNNLQKDLILINEQINELNKMKDVYDLSQYKQLINIKNDFDKNINNYDKLIIETQNKIQSYINNEYNKLLDTYNETDKLIKHKKEKIEKLTKQQNRYIYERNIKIKNKIKELEHKHLIISEEINNNIQTISYLNVLNTMNTDLMKLEQIYDSYTILEKLFNEHDLITNIIASLLTEIEKEVNNTLNELAGFKIKIEYDSIKYGINIYRILDDKIKISAKQMSGFEKEIVNIIFKIILNKFNTKFVSDFLIIDEGFTSYDKEHLNNINQLITLLKNTYKFVIIISHIDNLKDYFDKTIDITINNGDSNIFI